MKLCVIPARGGSKRIPRKNIRDFCGKPMIAWSIEAAKASACFDQIIVSTDDEEIAGVAKLWGAEAPFIRPAELSNDFVGTTPVVAHTVKWYQDQGQALTAVCCLYATAPLVDPNDLHQGEQLLKNSKKNTVVFSATSFPYPIQRAICIDPDGYAAMFNPECYSKRSQELIHAYHDAGQFYWAKATTWATVNNLFEGMRPLLLPRWRVQDIDTEEDWLHAEIIYKALNFQASSLL